MTAWLDELLEASERRQWSVDLLRHRHQVFLFTVPWPDVIDCRQQLGQTRQGIRCHLPTNNRGQTSDYFPVGGHVNVSWCRSHTNASGVIASLHIVASHIIKLLLGFRPILEIRFWESPQARIPQQKVLKTKLFPSTSYRPLSRKRHCNREWGKRLVWWSCVLRHNADYVTHSGIYA